MDAILDLARVAAWQDTAPVIETVFSSHLSQRDGREYDAFISSARSSHYSQSRAWAKVATAGKPFSPLFFLVRNEGRVIGAALVLRGCIAGVPLPIAQVERGPVCDKIADLPLVLDALKSCSLRHGIARLSVMPYWCEQSHIIDSWLEREGYADHQSFATRHARSLRLDLTAINEDEPFATPELAKVRQAIRRAERAGATVRQGQRADFAHFRRLNDELIRQQGGKTPHAAWYDALEHYFGAGGENGALFISEFEGEAIAAILITNHGGIATYALGASTGQNFKFPKMVLPMAHAILWAKRAGAATFDMGGIPLKGDPDPKRASIAEFKYGFSHTEISLVREHVRWF